MGDWFGGYELVLLTGEPMSNPMGVGVHFPFVTFRDSFRPLKRKHPRRHNAFGVSRHESLGKAICLLMQWYKKL